MTPDIAFECWSSYWGLLYEDHDERFPSRVYGFENHATGRAGLESIPEDGACYGFVASGAVVLQDNGNRDLVRLPAGMWFTTPNGCRLMIGRPGARVFLAQRIGFRGVFAVGGPIEERGRLRYIDGCSDSLLVAPPILGDPCLNHLHFPAGIDQTMHTHPSLRAGIVVRGRGSCVTPAGTTPLVPGLIFVIPTDAAHKFTTAAGESMDVVPYHPDSDWGPTHEEHPMVNRTLVGGQKIDNTAGRHAEAELVESRI